MEMQRKIRDDKYKLGLLKPDTFAEDRLLRQPPGVCIYLVMYNRYHNYVATQLRRINENGRFSVPAIYSEEKLVATIENCILPSKKKEGLSFDIQGYKTTWQKWKTSHQKDPSRKLSKEQEEPDGKYAPSKLAQFIDSASKHKDLNQDIKAFGLAYDAAWDKLDDDLFNTARL